MILLSASLLQENQRELVFFTKEGKKRVVTPAPVHYNHALAIVLSHGVDVETGFGLRGQQNHGLAGSSLRQGLTKPLQSGFRDSLIPGDFGLGYVLR